MPEYDNTNRFSLFPNKDKTEANPTWADFQGTINIEGVEYYISAWKPKAGANPKGPVLSGSVKPKEGGGQKKAAPEREIETNPGDAEAYFDSLPDF